MFSLGFEIPEGMQPKRVAETFAAYLMGDGAFTNYERNGDGDLAQGPYDLQTHWQLTGTNNFWLRINGRNGTLTCRSSERRREIFALVELFYARYNKYAKPIRDHIADT
jgi:hypothetical protein